jgi:hypothetical protein
MIGSIRRTAGISMYRDVVGTLIEPDLSGIKALEREDLPDPYQIGTIELA